MNQQKGEEKRKPGFTRPFSLLQIYQLRKATFWSDEWGAPQATERTRRNFILRSFRSIFFEPEIIGIAALGK